MDVEVGGMSHLKKHIGLSDRWKTTVVGTTNLNITAGGTTRYTMREESEVEAWMPRPESYRKDGKE